MRPHSTLGRLRAGSGISTTTLGRAIGGNRWTIENIENARRRIRPRELVILRTIFPGADLRGIRLQAGKGES